MTPSLLLLLACCCTPILSTRDACMGNCTCIVNNSENCTNLNGIQSINVVSLNETLIHADITIINGTSVYCVNYDHHDQRRYIVPENDNLNIVDIILYVVCCILLFPTVGFIYTGKHKRKKRQDLIV